MMKLTQPVGPTPLDTHPGIVGAPMDRVDGRAKVTGAARYAYEVPAEAPLYAYVVQATVAAGRITDLDTAAAERAPGVRLVLTHRNAPPQDTGDHRRLAGQLTGPEIKAWGQPVALVVADTFEQARAGAFLVRATYDAAPVNADLRTAAGSAIVPKPSGDEATDSTIGQFDAAMAAAPVQIDVQYATPPQTHAMMEPHATTARWDGDTLTVHTANQMVSQSQAALANTLRMPKEKVRLVSAYVGGGFGAKLWVGADCVLAAIAARQTGRTVKLALARPQVAHVTTHRSETVQRVRLGANPDGTLLAIGHDTLSGNQPGQGTFEGAAFQTRSLYAGANRQTRHRLAYLTVPVASSMRAPGEAVGLLALECAMDELAERLKIDPIELRLRNEPAADPERNIPYSSRNLVACLREGAARFGWDKRGRPGERTDGRWLLGMGVAAATRNNPLKDSRARVRLDPDGVLTVQMAMTDIGTGSYTIFTQVAASMLGLPAEAVRMELGDSSLPMAAGSGGSFGSGSAGSAVYDACMTLRQAVAMAAGFDPAQAVFENATVAAGGASRPLRGLAPPGGMVAEGAIDPGDLRKRFSEQSYGAQFAEVGVDRDTGEIRLRRMLGVFAAGRVLNAKTARSQAIGGMVFGVGGALEEELQLDTRFGLYVNHDLAEYHVPVHADIPAIDAVFLPELDDKSNPLKSKGVGELGICGAGAAVTNAVFNATGVRVRDFPITLDKVMGPMARA